MMSGIIFIYYSNDNIVIMQLLLSLLFYVDINFIDSFFTVVFFFYGFFKLLRHYHSFLSIVTQQCCTVQLTPDTILLVQCM